MDPQKNGRKGLIALVMLLLLPLTACVTHVVNLPANVKEKEVQDWYTTTGVFSVLGETLKDTTQLVISLNQQKLFPDGPSYDKTLEVLGKIAQTGLVVTDTLKKAPDQFGKGVTVQVGTFTDQILVDLDTASKEGVTGITDPDKSKQFSDVISRVRSGIQLVAAIVAARTGGK